ncbi:hypothetical protein LOTGIDRAFT_211230 [Lottia gigantea]|uniref:tRNA (guanine(9)-N(1))-methyltransferase n=1 Tax=Lottia gigantea TaxID=225164 RepID=V3Z132_LOTGI|nr:hypothetical protein LOTGIDRAFT_211230 [Lottia gigantea]ESO84248.1 hypothetical protein LOTGIDRAFT_211230 [Lottia gigantea]
MKDSTCCVRVVIDCSFDDMMTNKDVIHLTQQIQFYVSGISGKLKQRIEGIGDYRGWDINMKEESFETLFKKEEIIYLSSESPNILSTIEDDKVYIIGGFVDHNHYKGYCYELAEKKGLQHAQLPIGQYIDMKARKVLTINHVFEILLRYTECKNWQEAFYAVLPQRKGAIYKNTSEDQSSSNEGQESNCDIENTSSKDNGEGNVRELKPEDNGDSVSKVEIKINNDSSDNLVT